MEGTTTTSGGAAGEPWGSEAPATEQTQLLATAVGDTCSNCGTRLASDQHYCVECGERRGKPRYSVAGPTPMPAVSTARKAARSRASVGALWTGNGTLALIAGVGVLLMAMGVGVLIGRTSNGSTTAARTPTFVIPSGGAASGAPTTARPPAATAGRAAPKSPASTAPPKTAAAKAKKLQQLVKSVPKTIPKKLQSAVKTVGAPCSGGPGCTGGKFTGNFFGGG